MEDAHFCGERRRNAEKHWENKVDSSHAASPFDWLFWCGCMRDSKKKWRIIQDGGKCSNGKFLKNHGRPCTHYKVVVSHFMYMTNWRHHFPAAFRKRTGGGGCWTSIRPLEHYGYQWWDHSWKVRKYVTSNYVQGKVPELKRYLSWNSGKPHGAKPALNRKLHAEFAPLTRHGNAPVSVHVPFRLRDFALYCTVPQCSVTLAPPL